MKWFYINQDYITNIQDRERSDIGASEFDVTEEIKHICKGYYPRIIGDNIFFHYSGNKDLFWGYISLSRLDELKKSFYKYNLKPPENKLVKQELWFKWIDKEILIYGDSVKAISLVFPGLNPRQGYYAFTSMNRIGSHYTEVFDDILFNMFIDEKKVVSASDILKEEYKEVIKY